MPGTATRQGLWGIYRDAGFQPVLLHGYGSTNHKTGEVERYKEAKKPIRQGWNRPDYEGPSDRELEAHEEAGGWIGWKVPAGIAVIDCEDGAAIQMIDSYGPLRSNTNNGIHSFFTTKDHISGDSQAFTRSGLPVTFRSEGNYLVMPDTNGRTWAQDPDFSGLKPLPLNLFPYRRNDPQDVLNCLSFQIGAAYRAGLLRGFEDLDLSYMAYLTGLGLDESPVTGAFRLVFLNDFDERRTADLYRRTVSRRNGGGPLRGAGSFIDAIKTAKIDQKKFPVLRFLGELERLLKSDTGVKTEDSDTGATDTEDARTTSDLELLVTPVTPVTPFHVFPVSFTKAIKGIADAVNMDPEEVLCVALCILSGCLGNAIRVSPKAGWIEPVFLWLMLIMDTGHGKTPLFRALMTHIHELQAAIHKEYEEKRKTYEKALRDYRKDEFGTLPQPPKCKHLFCSDLTVEGLAAIYGDDPRGLIIHRDELAGLVCGMDQYKGRGDDRQHYLELWNGDPWKIDRKAGTKYISSTGAAIIGGIQPKIAAQTFNEAAFNDGLIYRFFILQKDHGPQRFNDRVIVNGSLEYWNGLIDYCLSQTFRVTPDTAVTPNARIIHLKGDSLEPFINLYDTWHETRPFLTNTSQGFIPKFIAYALRLTGVLQAIHCHSMNRDIPGVADRQVVEGACEMTRYLAARTLQALRIYGKVDSFTETQKRLIRALYDLQGHVEKGLLKLSLIVDLYNEDLSRNLHIHAQRAAYEFKTLELTTEKRDQNRSFLVWNQPRIEKLFSRIGVTRVTTVTGTDLEDYPESDAEVVTRVTRVTEKDPGETVLNLIDTPFEVVE